jgi:ferredoxin
MAVVLDSEECLGCGCCIDACDFGALLLHLPSQGVFDKAVVDEDLCTDCEECIAMCTTGALRAGEGAADAAE